MTTINEVEDNTPEFYYNNRLKTVSSLIERVNGVLKMRFRYLLKQRVLHYKPMMAAKIVNACCVLHNMFIANNVPEPPLDAEDENQDYGLYPPEQLRDEARVGRVNPELEAGRRVQGQVIRMLSQRRQQRQNNDNAL